MKEIPLTKGRVTLVDDDQYEKLSKNKWHVNSDGYVCRDLRANGTRKMVLMHREIMGVSFSGIHTVVDHINHDKLNNTKTNLRICSIQQNSSNQSKHKYGMSSGYKGVYWDKEYSKWRSNIRPNGKSIFLGRFDDEIEAAIAYNKAAQKYYGEFALLNEIPA